MKRFIVVLVIVVATSVCSGSGFSECLTLEPATVELQGIIQRTVFPGPPSYESVKHGDKPETYWVLCLKNNVCVDGTATGVKKIQLVLEEGGYQTYKQMLGKKVSVKGTLFEAQTGHHHTDILMNVSYMNLLNANN